MEKTILLPGLSEQLRLLVKSVSTKNKKILVMGSHSEFIAEQLLSASEDVTVIVEDEYSLLESRFRIGRPDLTQFRLMSFSKTDFPDSTFDIVFAQASITNSDRNKIFKEIKRILKPAGKFSLGEIVSLNFILPKFVNDILSRSNLVPIYFSNLISDYTSKGFKILLQQECNAKLKEYYETIKKILLMDPKLKGEIISRYDRKLYDKISHELNAYLKLGMEKHIGFYISILEKED